MDPEEVKNTPKIESDKENQTQIDRKWNNHPVQQVKRVHQVPELISVMTHDKKHQCVCLQDTRLCPVLYCVIAFACIDALKELFCVGCIMTQSYTCPDLLC